MQKSKVVIIDYDSGNLQSVLNALESVKNNNQEIIITSNSNDLKSASHIVLPGVSSFHECVYNLKKIPLMIQELKKQVLLEKKPFLGICAGMQLLTTTGYEDGKNEGLNFIKGKVVKINNQNNSIKIPHMGWNNIDIKINHKILSGIKSGDHFYFANSYHFICNNDNDILATVDYGQEITAMIAKDNIIATQFHPEKSSETGLKLLKNFINLKVSLNAINQSN